MDLIEEFSNKEQKFHSIIKKEILEELNKNVPIHIQSIWGYEDGFFSIFVENPRTLLILKSDFEPYTFNTLQIIYEDFIEEIEVVDVDLVFKKLNEILGE